jgi:hypothetical protein
MSETYNPQYPIPTFTYDAEGDFIMNSPPYTYTYPTFEGITEQYEIEEVDMELGYEDYPIITYASTYATPAFMTWVGWGTNMIVLGKQKPAGRDEYHLEYMYAPERKERLVSYMVLE